MNDRSERHSAFGSSVAFGDGVQVIGVATMRIGDGSCIGDNVWLNDCLRDGEVRIRIGRRVLIGRGTMVSSAGHLEIGDYVLTGPNCLMTNADHVFEDVMQPYVQQGAVVGGRMIIEENCWLGFGAKIIGSLTVGRGSVIAAGAVVLGDVPPFSVVAGVPAKVVKMYDFESRAWLRVNGEAGMATALAQREEGVVPNRTVYAEALERSNRVSALGRELAGCAIDF